MRAGLPRGPPVHSRVPAVGPSCARSPAAASQMAVNAAAAAASDPPPAAFVYSGPGAGTRSVLSTLQSLREVLLPSVKVDTLETAQLLAGGWQPGCLLLVMPGGADLPYCKHLNGKGNQLIREYVEGGGSYLGLCAGAYYGCGRVEFEPGSRLEVVGTRELAFFPGTAAGSIYRGFDYESEAGAVAAPLRFRQLGAAPTGGQRSPGGDSSSGGSGRDCGEGSGGHAGSREEPGEWAECVDYVNGGPCFRLLDGSPLTPLLLAQPRQQGMQQHQALQPDAYQQAGQQRAEVQPLPSQVQQHLKALEGVELLATYPEHDDAAAALLCHVGRGRAVLCGTHPELHPAWLAGQPPSTNGSADGRSGSSSSSSSSVGAGSGELVAAAASGLSSLPGGFVDSVGNRAAAASALAAELAAEGHVQQLQAALQAGQEQRQHFWRSLLAAAGMGPWMQPADTDN